MAKTPQTSSPLSGAHLRVDGLSVSFPDRRVLTDVSFTVSAGERAGLIGENGSGKSTLLRAAAGLLRPTSGTIKAYVPGVDDPQIGLLHQRPPFTPEETVGDALERAVAPARIAAQGVTDLGTLVASNPDDERIAELYGQVLQEAERLDAWEVDTKIAQMLAGLELSDIEFSRPTGQLSGGQRARLSLAWLLLSAPDILLLDEPTNHLDAAATTYLVSVLEGWRGPVLMASHDRAFLDDAATSLIDLDPAPVPHAVSKDLTQDGSGSGIGVTRFTGNYSDYLQFRDETMRRWKQTYRDQQDELKKLRASVHDQHSVGHAGRGPRTEAKASKKFYSDRNAKVVSRRVNDARSKLEEAENAQVRRPPEQLVFRGLVPEQGDDRSSARQAESRAKQSLASTEPVLIATEVSVEGRLDPVSIGISRGEKWLLTGPNGSGKSTLLNVLADRLKPTTGSITRADRDRVRLLSQDTDIQEIMSQAVPQPSGRGTQAGPSQAYRGETTAQVYQLLVGEELASKVPLSTFGLIEGRDLNRPLRDLSVGQQRRLALAAILADPPEILLLDEPTNHFSLSLATEIEAALPDYPGTVVVASHDRWLMSHWDGSHLSLG